MAATTIPRKHRLVFVTATRADFGKLKSLLTILSARPDYELHLFVTGMHMLAKYGYTCDEVERCGYKNIHKYINQNYSDTMDGVLAKTIGGFSDYVKEIQPDLIVVHGDRVEALAGAIVGSLNNMLVAHIEGGEVSGTIDGLMRHAITKMSHLHFVANDEARRRLLQLGEANSSIHIIGSPDIDIMTSPDLPAITEVRSRYALPDGAYAVAMLHPVTTELALLPAHAVAFVDTLLADAHQYVVIFPNNDTGAAVILQQYERLQGNARFRVIPSMRFEYFLRLMKDAAFLIGNSSAGVREAPFYGVPSINVGSRQHQRGEAPTILNVDFAQAAMHAAISKAKGMRHRPSMQFGSGNSAALFLDALNSRALWETTTQKYFVDQAP